MLLLSFLGLSCGATVVAHRCVRRFSPHVAGVLVAMPLLFVVGPLFTGKVLVPVDIVFSFLPHRATGSEFAPSSISPPNYSDVAVMLLPWQAAVREAYAHGSPPLWNPYVAAGDLLLASMQPAPFYPLNVLALPLPLPDAAGFVYLATLLLAGLGMYLLLRDMGVRSSAALFGATAFELSKYVFFWSHWNVGYVASLAPFVLLVARRVAARISRGTFWATVLLAGAVVVAGHPESALVLCVPAALFFFDGLREAPADARVRAALRVAGACAIGLALTAPVYLPFLEAIPQSYESGFRKTELYRSVVGALPLSKSADRASASFVPFTRGVFGKEIPEKARGGFSGDEATGYCGTVALVVAALALGRRKRLAGTCAALAGLGVLLACRLPGLVQLVQQVPLFDQLIFDYFYLWAALGTCCLAGLGVEAWLGEDAGPPRVAVVAGIALLLTVAVLWFYPHLRAEGLSRRFLVREASVALLPLIGVLALAARRPNRLWTAGCLIALLVAQRGFESAHQVVAVPRDQFYPRVAPIETAIRSADGARVSATDDLLVPNTPTMYGLHDVRGYNAITLRRFKETFPLWVQPESVIFNRLADPDAPMLTFLNVALILEPSSAPPRAGWSVLAEANGVRLVRNPRPGRAAIVPTRVVLGGSAEQRLEEMRHQEDYQERSWIDFGDGRLEPRHEEANGPGEVEVEAEGPDLRLRVHLERDAWVAVPVTHWKGWVATEGDDELPVAYANHAFVAVRAPAGSHTVLLRYRPRSWIWGLRLATSTALAVLLVAIGRATWRRRGVVPA